ncbi:MAG: hypothetical protein HKL90_00860 [Elusimicrobia bacterium]|nr:hypothetical protein [Elusimicrobiota bacterium]
MKKVRIVAVVTALLAGAVFGAAPRAAAQIFPNDAGPTKIDVSSYPKEMQKTYAEFQKKCSNCHTIARPINAQFVELNAEEEAKARKDQPDLFTDTRLIDVSEHAWNRLVKRMMAKPGCPVNKMSGKRIWEFLVYDSKARKTGAKAAAWKAARLKLVEDFEKKHPDDYKRLFPK